MSQEQHKELPQSVIELGESIDALGAAALRVKQERDALIAICKRIISMRQAVKAMPELSGGRQRLAIALVREIDAAKALIGAIEGVIHETRPH